MPPLVTIYIPTYNRRDLLQRAVDSARGQSYPSVEIIVVDDCSSDGTKGYLQGISNEDSRVKAFFKPANSGACASRNIAIRHAAGHYITGLDDDDYLTPDHIQRLVSHHESSVRQDGQVIAVFPQMATLDEIGDLKLMRQPLAEVRLEDLKDRNYVGNQVFATKATYEQAGLFNEALPAWQDFDLWLRMASQGVAFAKCCHPTYIYEPAPSAGKISSGSHAKLLEAYRIMSSNPQLSLTERERLTLKMNYFRYPQVPMSTADLASYFRNGIVVSPLKTFAKKMVRSLIGNDRTLARRA